MLAPPGPLASLGLVVRWEYVNDLRLDERHSILFQRLRSMEFRKQQGCTLPLAPECRPIPAGELSFKNPSSGRIGFRFYSCATPMLPIMGEGYLGIPSKPVS